MKIIIAMFTMLVSSLSSCTNHSSLSHITRNGNAPIDTIEHTSPDLGIVYESVSGNMVITGDWCADCPFDSNGTTRSNVSVSIESAELGITNETIRLNCQKP